MYKYIFDTPAGETLMSVEEPMQNGDCVVLEGTMYFVFQKIFYPFNDPVRLFCLECDPDFLAKARESAEIPENYLRDLLLKEVD